jgi:DNA-binding transcriptional MerR regulator
VTPRTIRYYTAEGLLPPPQAQGRNAIYSDDHFRRLCLIQRLKNAFLPLWEIKAQVCSLTSEEVEMLLSRKPVLSGESESTTADTPAAPESTAKQGQLNYLTQIIAATEPPVAAIVAPPPRRILLVSPVFQASPDSAVLPSSASSDSPQTSREVWERIVLAEGVELHVQTPATAEERELLEQRIASARALFTTHTPGNPS